MPQFNGDVIFLDGSGQVRATNGSLTLRADDTALNDIIIGSGAALRPEMDLSINLGRDSHRWFSTHTGHLAAHSGYLGVDPQVGVPNLIWDSNGFSAAGLDSSTHSFQFVQMSVVLASCELVLGGGSSLKVEGNAEFQSNVLAPDITTVRVLPVFDNNPGSIIGSQDFRFESMSASSGLFNSLAAPTSGTWIGVEGSLVPLRHNIYSLGTSPQRWAGIYASSGVMNEIFATNITGDAIQANFSIFSLGSVLALTDISSFGTIGAAGITTFAGPVFLSSVTGPTVDAGATSVGVQGLRLGYMYAVSGFFETISPITSGSFTTLNGSFVPDRTNMRGLGTNSLRWANVFATSGEYTTLKTRGVDVPNKSEAVTVLHSIGPSGAHINTNQARDIYNYTIPANTLTPSGRLKLEIFGTITNMSAAPVNFTPVLEINGTNIYGDVLAVTAAPVPGNFDFSMDLLQLGSMTGNHIRGRVGLGSRVAGTIRGIGNFGAADPDCLWLQEPPASGTINFASPVNIRVSMTMGTASTLASYSGFYAQLVHYPFPTI